MAALSFRNQVKTWSDSHSAVHYIKLSLYPHSTKIIGASRQAHKFVFFKLQTPALRQRRTNAERSRILPLSVVCKRKIGPPIFSLQKSVEIRSVMEIP